MADDFKQFLETRRSAASAYVNGDYAPLSEIVAQHSPATFFSPMGDVTEAASAVAARYDKDAAAFDTGGTTRLEILHCDSSGDLGYWVGYRIVKSYYHHADDKSQALRDIFEMTDPSTFLAESGWRPGIKLD